MSDLGVGIDKLYSQIRNALDNVTALNTTIEMSKELLRMRKKSFQEGMATSTDVIDAEIMLSKVQIAYLMAFYQYRWLTCYRLVAYPIHSGSIAGMGKQNTLYLNKIES